jgi:cell shape-determining protein MreC
MVDYGSQIVEFQWLFRRGAVNAILKGNGLARNDKLLFLPQNAVLENNDQIYTSGSDGVIKEGLVCWKNSHRQ